jgi:hypothetical protein
MILNPTEAKVSMLPIYGVPFPSNPARSDLSPNVTGPPTLNQIVLSKDLVM